MPLSARGLAVAGWGSITHGKDLTVYSQRMGKHHETKVCRMFPSEADRTNKRRWWRTFSVALTDRTMPDGTYHLSLARDGTT